ncbi:MAG: response regulator [Lachnospiraceae bacterium]|nr:response regulator [Lachnospiraceae bacterium]
MLFYKAQIYCMIIITLLFCVCWLGIKQKSRENKIFTGTLLAAFVNLCFDIASNYTVNHLETTPPLVNRIVHWLFFISMATLFLLVYKYMVALIEKEVERQLHGRIISCVPYGVVFWLTMLLPLQYIETPQGNYSYGPAVFALYACVAIYIILIIELIIRHQRNISAKNKTAIILGLVFVLSASLFQMIIPAALTSSLGVLLFCLSVYMTVANPDAVLVELLKKETARADAANRAKSDFLAKMSHEIRTPINAVLGMNEMILRESNEAETKKYAHDIKSSASSLLSIINEILDASKIESGKMEIVPDNYEISSMLNDLYNMILVRAKDKELELVFHIDPEIPSEYYGDDIRIRQVLVNLLTNAVKYTTKGTVTLTLTGKREGENAVLHFSVRDTGIGIKAEDVEKLFAKFQRIEEVRNRHIEGTGLGMNIAMQLLKLMDSELQVQSEYGQGSEFSFDLVQKIVNEEPLGDFQERILRVAKEYKYQTGYIAPEAKILVVDDNEMNRKVFKSLLKQTRMQVLEAEGGIACLEMVKQHAFHIIFLDHMMPEMDGIETLHALREQKLCGDIPVIMLTANAVVGAKEQYLKEGFHDFLTKPIMPDKLDGMILQYLPKELVQKGEYSREPVQDVGEVTLPALEEFDFSYAMRVLKSQELLQKTLIDFHGFLKSLEEKLSILLEGIEEDTVLQSYQIEVHALKSTAAMVGALLLSKLARMLEVAAAEQNRERIRALHPILLEEIEKHRQRIGELLPREEKPQIEIVTEALPYLGMLKAGLENEDYNTVDFVFAEVNKYQYPAQIQLKIDGLAEQIMNLEAEAAVETVEEREKMMQGEI